MGSAVSESKVLLFELWLQFSILCYKSSLQVQFLVVLLVVIKIEIGRIQ